MEGYPRRYGEVLTGGGVVMTPKEARWSPSLAEAYGEVLKIRAFGDAKHGPWTWGPVGRLAHILAAMRHLIAAMASFRDKDSKERHLAHAAARSLLACACEIDSDDG